MTENVFQVRAETRIARGFDRLAPIYDGLTAFVFGGAIRRSQTCFLGSLAESAEILVVGGGTGWFLEQLLSRSRGRVDYLDISSGMLRRAENRISRRRPADRSRVRFIRGGPGEIPLGPAYDAVCTHCFLDLFSDETLAAIVDRLVAHMAPGGVWYVSDFRPIETGPAAPGSRALLWTMYRFFGVLCRIEAGRLPEIETALAARGLSPRKQRDHFGGMLRSQLFEPDPSGAPGVRER